MSFSDTQNHQNLDSDINIITNFSTYFIRPKCSWKTWLRREAAIFCVCRKQKFRILICLSLRNLHHGATINLILFLQMVRQGESWFFGNWNGSTFLGLTTYKRSFGMTISFTSLLNSASCKLTTVYGPCRDPARSDFVLWLPSDSIATDENWLFLEDFSFYRSLEDRNKHGENVQDTLIFNDIIGHLGLVEFSLKGRAFTWSNMQ